MIIKRETLRIRADALERLRSAVAGAQGKGATMSFQEATSGALERFAKQLETDHNGGQVFPKAQLKPGRRKK